MRFSLRYTLALAILLAGCHGQEDRAVLDATPGYVCNPPGKTTYGPWGQAGVTKACLDGNGKIAGTSMAAEWGRIFFVENFDQRQKRWVVEYYDKEGRVEKRVEKDSPGNL
jgi:hypothetical protein